MISFKVSRPSAIKKQLDTCGSFASFNVGSDEILSGLLLNLNGTFKSALWSSADTCRGTKILIAHREIWRVHSADLPLVE